MICWKCGKNIVLDKVMRTTECPLCHADLHCCKGCKYFSPGNHYDCKETVDDVIVDKEKSNFCDFFHISDTVSNGTNKDKAAAAKDAFNALFG